MIIVKKKRELIRFVLFVALAAGLLLYVMRQASDWQKASSPLPVTGQSLGGAAGRAKSKPAGSLPAEGLPGQVELGGESYFADSRVTRDQQLAEQREQLQAVMNNEKTDAETRKAAQQRYLGLGEQAARAVQAESLIKGKGFQDAVVTISDESASVVVKGEPITQSQFVQIADLVSRVTGVRVDHILVWSRPR